MLKSFFHAPSDQLTPKASEVNRNPFDSLNLPQSPSSNPSSRKSSISFFNLPLTSSKDGTTTPKTSTGLFPHHQPGKEDLAPPASPLTPGSASLLAGFSNLTAAPTVAISTNEPDFTLKSNINSSSLAKKRDSGSSPRGKLYVKFLQGRNLASTSVDSKPYVVASFDQNDFVSREPISSEHEAEVISFGQKILGQNGIKKVHSAIMTPIATKDKLGGISPSGLTKSLEAYKKSEEGKIANGSPKKAAQTLLPAPAFNPVWKHEVIFDVAHEQSKLQISVYDRSVEDQGFLGQLEIKPRLVHGFVLDDWFQLKPREDGQRVAGDVRVSLRYEKLEGKKLAASDFDFLKMIGKGTFGRVFQVRKKDTKRIYAMKVLSKKEIIAKKEVAHTIGERKILQRSSECPFLLGLKFSFQSETDLFLVMDYKSGGELFHHLQREGRFTEERARFYTAEIVLAFEHLHKFDIVYRDLKPENILLDATGHLVLCDFGLSKPDLPSDALTNTFCGTTEYLAPEVLLDDHGYSKLVDFWSLGVLLFEMCCGWSPFYAEDTQTMYKNICFGKIKFPRGVIGDDGKQFVKGLLNRNPKNRLGSKRDAAELKEHPFFKTIDWEALFARQVSPPFKPIVESDESVANFDPEFTEVDILTEAPRAAFYDDTDNSDAWLHQRGGVDWRSSSGSIPVPIERTGMAVNGKKGKDGPHGRDDLTNSVQDNFRGFSYAGESPMEGSYLAQRAETEGSEGEVEEEGVTIDDGGRRDDELMVED